MKEPLKNVNAVLYDLTLHEELDFSITILVNNFVYIPNI
jgi:hypothetical protein